jgi:hypothetical protein
VWWQVTIVVVAVPEGLPLAVTLTYDILIHGVEADVLEVLYFIDMTLTRVMLPELDGHGSLFLLHVLPVVVLLNAVLTNFLTNYPSRSV